MFVDPITVAAAAPTPALNFALIQFDGMKSVRSDATNDYSLTTEHTPTKSGKRHYMQIKKRLLVVDPVSGGSSYQEASVSVTIFVPKYGFDSTAMAALYKALTDTIADADVTVTKFLQDQS